MNLLEKKAYVDSKIHLVPEQEVQLFNNNFACVFAKHSACIDNTASISVEEVVSITKGHNVKGIDEDLKRKVYNIYKAYILLLDMMKEKREFNADMIKDLHEVILSGYPGGGLYRNTNIRINNSNYVPCDPIKIYKRMTKYFDQYDFGGLTGLTLASFAHMQFAKIHPFLDGNGRVGRLILNYVLVKEGYLPISIPVSRKYEYFDYLELYKVGVGELQEQKNDPMPFVHFLEDLENKEYDRLIELIKRYDK